MTSEQNKAIVRRFYGALVTNDLATLNDVLAPDLVAHSQGAPGPQSREVHLQGIRNKYMERGFRNGFHDP